MSLDIMIGENQDDTQSSTSAVIMRQDDHTSLNEHISAKKEAQQ